MAVFRSRAQPTSASHTLGAPAVAQALSEWGERVEQARRDGREQGLAEAQARVAAAEKRAAEAEKRAAAAAAQADAAAEARLGGALAAFAAAAAGLPALERQLVAAAEGEAVALGLAVAARILRREVEAGPGWVEPVVAAALARVPDRRRVEVRLNPADAEAARACAAVLRERTPGLDELAIAADDGLPRGSCVLASQGTRLDASIASSWERLAVRLLAAAPAPALEQPCDGAGVAP